VIDSVDREEEEESESVLRANLSLGMEFDDAIDQITEDIVKDILAGDVESLNKAVREIERYSSHDLILQSLHQKGSISLLVKKMNSLSKRLGNEDSEELESLVDRIAQSVAYLSGPTGTHNPPHYS
jgi:hypothetical protein